MKQLYVLKLQLKTIINLNALWQRNIVLTLLFDSFEYSYTLQCSDGYNATISVRISTTIHLSVLRLSWNAYIFLLASPDIYLCTLKSKWSGSYFFLTGIHHVRSWFYNNHRDFLFFPFRRQLVSIQQPRVLQVNLIATNNDGLLIPMCISLFQDCREWRHYTVLL